MTKNDIKFYNEVDGSIDDLEMVNENYLLEQLNNAGLNADMINRNRIAINGENLTVCCEDYGVSVYDENMEQTVMTCHSKEGVTDFEKQVADWLQWYVI